MIEFVYFWITCLAIFYGALLLIFATLVALSLTFLLIAFGVATVWAIYHKILGKDVEWYWEILGVKPQ